MSLRVPSQMGNSLYPSLSWELWFLQKWRWWLSDRSKCVGALIISQWVCMMRHIIDVKSCFERTETITWGLSKRGRGVTSRRLLVRGVQDYELHDCKMKTKVKYIVHQMHCTPTTVSPTTGVFAFNWFTSCPSSISMYPIEKQLVEDKMLPYIPIHT